MSLFADQELDPTTSDDILQGDSNSLCDPLHMQLCFGHDTQEAAMLERVAQNRLPHGLIFAGVKGIGKATFAHRLARFLLTHDGAEPDDGGLFGDAVLRAENAA